MDSSRSGLLSTLLMTLPLIVVPAIALLRPPGPTAGVSTAPLDASESTDDFLDDLGDLEHPRQALQNPQESGDPKTAEDSPDFDDLFGELDEESPAPGPDQSQAGNNPRVQEKSRPETDDSFSPFDVAGGDSKVGDRQSRNHPEDAAQKIIERLNSRGALRTMWFEAGPGSPVGFAAFFRGETELMRIRFEAVGQTREECARSVFDQVTQWQAAQVVRGQ